MWLCMVSALAAAPLSGGSWVSGSAPIAAGALEVAGGAEGWLVVGRSGVPALAGQRVAPDGTLRDPVPFELLDPDYGPDVVWDGASFVVLSATNVDYYLRQAKLEGEWIAPVGPPQPTRQTLAEGLGWPDHPTAACDGSGSCVVVIQDIQPPYGNTAQVAFDATGATGPSWLEGGFGERPTEAVRDGDSTLLATLTWDGRPEVVWVPADLATPPERHRVAEGSNGLPELAMGSDGVALVVWADPSSGHLLAHRVQRGVGLLEAAPFDLGVGEAGSEVDVAFSGASFVVVTAEHSQGRRVLVRVDEDGAVVETHTWPADHSTHPRVVTGAPGHLLWTWFAQNGYRYATVEVDLADGEVCSDDAGCVSESCVDGVCGPPVAETGDTGVPAIDSGTIEEPTEGDSGVPAEVSGDSPGCGCRSTSAAGSLVPLWVGLWARRRRTR